MLRMVSLTRLHRGRQWTRWENLRPGHVERERAMGARELERVESERQISIAPDARSAAVCRRRGTGVRWRKPVRDTPRPESCELQKTDGDGFGNLNPEYYMRQGVRKRVVTRVQVRFLPFDDGRRGTEYS